MINGLSFDVEDWFQVENLREACPVEKWDTYELRVEKSVTRILELLSQYNTKATFFILGWIAERLPHLVKEIAVLGHEVASHGYNHEIVCYLSKEEFESDLLKSKSILENIINQPVIGYRAPNFSITNESLWAIDILARHGFRYDSSIFPVSFHDRYGFRAKVDGPFTFNNGLKELPLTTYSLGKMNIPIAGGGYFRLMPYSIFRWFLKRVNKSGRHFIFYLHPWEIDEGQPRLNIKYNFRIRHYLNLDKTYGRLEKLLAEFRFNALNTLI